VGFFVILLYLYENKNQKKTMKKIVKLTERDLTRLVKKVIKEDEDTFMDYEDRLDIIKGNLDDFEYELYDIENNIERDNDLDSDEKEELIDYVYELISRCERKRKR
jgi:hypothetical protein